MVIGRTAVRGFIISIMRDMKLYSVEGTSSFDIDIQNGYPVDVDYASQSQDQRAAIGAVFEKYTLPGNLEFGVNWAALYSKDSELLSISNDIQQTIAQVSGGDGTALGTYLPIFVPREDGSVGVTVLKGAI